MKTKERAIFDGIDGIRGIEIKRKKIRAFRFRIRMKQKRKKAKDIRQDYRITG